MERLAQLERTDDPSLPGEDVAATYRDLARVHRWLGNNAAILRLLRDGRAPVRSVLDIGCGHGALLVELERELGVEVVGFDLRPAPDSAPVRILTGNAVVDPLPGADVAIALCVAHHLSPDELVALIRNVSRSSRRLILLDLVRHRLPLVLFRLFATPFLHPISVADGLTSIRRSYTPVELRRIVASALSDSGARVDQRVAPFYTRQVLDISW
jgi:SAM-dependent methyltransferase